MVGFNVSCTSNSDNQLANHCKFVCILIAPRIVQSRKYNQGFVLCDLTSIAGLFTSFSSYNKCNSAME